MCGGSWHNAHCTEVGLVESRIAVRPDIRLRPVSGAIAGDLSDLILYQLKLMAYHLQLVAGFDELMALEDIAFQPFDYQAWCSKNTWCGRWSRVC